MNKTFDTQYLTAKEFADELRISVKTLYNKINKGEIVPLKLGSGRTGRLRFTREHIKKQLGDESEQRPR